MPFLCLTPLPLCGPLIDDYFASFSSPSLSHSSQNHPSDSSSMPCPENSSPVASNFETSSLDLPSSTSVSIPPTTTLPTSSSDPSRPTSRAISNSYHMTTRTKARIFKSRILLTEYLENEPPNFKLALKCPH